MVEITDFESAKAWLDTQEHQTQIWFASRCSLRTFPSLGFDSEKQIPKVATDSLRALLISTAGCTCTESDLEQLRDRAYAAHYNAHSGAIVSHSASLSVHAVADAESSSASAADSSVFSNAYVAANTDIQFPKQWPKLWYGTAIPEKVFEGWLKLKSLLNNDPEVWGFWIQWYEGILYGRPLPWGLTFEIAISLTVEDWDAGPRHVADRIREVQRAYFLTKTRLAETVTFNSVRSKFDIIPNEVAKPSLLSATLAQVEDALDDVLENPSNGLNDTSQETRVIRRTLTKHGNNPQQIEMGFTSTHTSLTRKIISEELPPSDENLALQRALEEGAQGIRATDPDIAENRRILDQQKFAELSEAQKSTLADAAPMLDAISEGVMQEDFAEDIAFVLSEDMRAPPYIGGVDRNPVLAGYDEKRRIFSRVAKIAVLMRKSPEIILKIDASAGFKAAGILTTIAGLVQLAISLL